MRKEPPTRSKNRGNFTSAKVADQKVKNGARFTSSVAADQEST